MARIARVVVPPYNSTHISTGCPLGDDKFIEEAGNIIGRNLSRKKPGPKKKGN